MNHFPEQVKQKLDSIINDMAENHWLFTNNPGHHFMRQHSGKLSFSDTMKLLLSMGKDTTAQEIDTFFHLDPDLVPSHSAVIQRRNQISLDAFQYLFTEFSASFPEITHRFHDHCILAADGTHIVYSTNSQIIEDFNKPRLAEHKGYNHMHLNGLFDALSKTALAVRIQPGQQPDERQALHEMLDHFHPDSPEKNILTADRGYESYDLIFHCLQKKLRFVFRAKSPQSNSLLTSFLSDLPDDQEEFDVLVRRFLTDKKSNIIKEQRDVYTYMNPNKNIPHFYPLLQGHILFLELRVVKVKTGEDSYEYLITNLPYSLFSTQDIALIYHFRWGCEISFRYLKHAAGMLYFHSKKPELIKQEIYSTLTLYNFGIFLANEASREYAARDHDPDNKYLYEIDYSNAIRTTRQYLLRSPEEKPIDLIRLLCKRVHAVKEEFRQFKRSLRGISAIRFAYR